MEELEDVIFNYFVDVVIEIVFGSKSQVSVNKIVCYALERLQVRENIREFLSASNTASTRLGAGTTDPVDETVAPSG